MWQRHRSAPAGALALAVVATTLTAALAVGVALSLAHTARGLPAMTAGLPRGSFARPTHGRAAYEGGLAGPDERATPAGLPAAAHRWRVFDRRDPSRALCSGAAEDGLSLRGRDGALALAAALPDELFALGATTAPPPRLRATCAGAADVASTELGYEEARVAPGAALFFTGCARASGPADAEAYALGPCDDGTPARVYPRAQPAQAHAALRWLAHRAAAAAAALATLCLAAGVLALERFARAEGGDAAGPRPLAARADARPSRRLDDADENDALPRAARTAPEEPPS